MTAAAGLLLVLTSAATSLGAAWRTERVDVSSRGAPARFGSGGASLSADGRFVAFGSASPNLVSPDAKGADGEPDQDVFVRDRLRRTTSRVSVASSGREANADSGSAVISASGRYVAFFSDATNLASGTRRGSSYLYVHDRERATTQLVSRNLTGRPQEASDTADISAGGRFVAYDVNLDDGPTRATAKYGVFIRDRRRGRTRRVAPRFAESFGPSLSNDGRRILFAASTATPDGLRPAGLQVLDRRTGRSTRVNVSSREDPANDVSFDWSLSGNGRFAIFGSYATNLVPGDQNGAADVFVRDIHRGTTRRVNVLPNGSVPRACPINDPELEEAEPGTQPICAQNPAISGNGRIVTFTAGMDGPAYVRDLWTSTTRVLSVRPSGRRYDLVCETDVSDGGKYAITSSCYEPPLWIHGPLR